MGGDGISPSADRVVKSKIAPLIHGLKSRLYDIEDTSQGQ